MILNNSILSDVFLNKKSIPFNLAASKSAIASPRNTVSFLFKEYSEMIFFTIFDFLAGEPYISIK